MKRIALCLLALIAACSDDDKKSGGDDVRTGRFVDSPVAQLHYQTATQSGETDTEGGFRYRADETVTFSIGGVTLGSALAAETMSPFSLFGVAPPSTLAEVEPYLVYGSNVTDFDRAVNVAFFLQALDADGNPGNGIDLSGRAEALANASISFDVTAGAFVNYGMKSFALLYGVANTNFTLATAIAHLYTTLGVSVTSNVVATDSRDADNDGTVDTSYRYEYDASGRRTKVTRYSGADITRVETTTYDAAGRVLTYTYSRNPNGAGEFQRIDTDTNVYAADGALAQVTSTSVDDGVLEETTVTTYEYDAAGRMTASVEDTTEEGERQIERVAFTYDLANLTVSERHENDEDGNGTTDSVEVYATTFDTRGNRVRTTWDDNADGSFESWTDVAMTYDDRGRRTREVTTERNPAGEALFDYTYAYVYDANGRVTSYAYFDGTDEATSTSRQGTTTEYDATGRRTKTTMYWSGSGSPGTSEVSTYTYTATGRLSVRASTGYRDGNPTPVSRYSETSTYDANDQLTGVRTESDSDGTGTDVDVSITTLTYIQVANGLFQLFEDLGQGMIL